MSVCFQPLCCNSAVRGKHSTVTDVRIKDILAAAADFVSLHINSLNKQKNWTNLSFVKFSTGVQHHNTNSDCFLEKTVRRDVSLRKHMGYCRQLPCTVLAERLLTNPQSTSPGFLSSRHKEKEFAFLVRVRINLFFSPFFLIERIEEKEWHLQPLCIACGFL